ncbi:MAG: sterol desaturase/sphingolipid hydroxylase (fatty acid hydroxylase superfamily) [Saprospiraceae bacterium]|jgi:sterol desaturase/sphingolipid hydroxylase (fatty acid hydroxylase superfamily)
MDISKDFRDIASMDWNTIVSQLQADNLLILAFPLFLLVVGIEFYYDKIKDLGLYQGKDFLVSASMAIITVFVEFIPKILAFGAFYYLHELSPLKDVVLRQWWAWGILFFLDDFAYYWFHRMNHEVRLFWAGHVAHHSSEKMNFGTALRQGAGERLHKYFFWLPIALLGFDPLMMFIAMSINLAYQFWVHTELVDKLPKLIEYIFNTPSHHRVHHASNILYLDRNHAGALIIWDRLLGTFAKEIDSERPVYGLTKNITSFNPLHVATHEYGAIWKDVRRASNWSDKLNYIFKAPGWSHDGKDLRAATLRRALQKSIEH